MPSARCATNPRARIVSAKAGGPCHASQRGNAVDPAVVDQMKTLGVALGLLLSALGGLIQLNHFFEERRGLRAQPTAIRMDYAETPPVAHLAAVVRNRGMARRYIDYVYVILGTPPKTRLQRAFGLQYDVFRAVARGRRLTVREAIASRVVREGEEMIGMRAAVEPFWLEKGQSWTYRITLADLVSEADRALTRARRQQSPLGLLGRGLTVIFSDGEGHDHEAHFRGWWSLRRLHEWIDLQGEHPLTQPQS